MARRRNRSGFDSTGYDLSGTPSASIFRSRSRRVRQKEKRAAENAIKEKRAIDEARLAEIEAGKEARRKASLGSMQGWKTVAEIETIMEERKASSKQREKRVAEIGERKEERKASFGFMQREKRVPEQSATPNIVAYKTEDEERKPVKRDRKAGKKEKKAVKMEEQRKLRLELRNERDEQRKVKKAERNAKAAGSFPPFHPQGGSSHMTRFG